ncbi:DUF5304 family protein [Streptomyces sp. SPB074]|uniref:DUF5304 family protein n=1 Tax=Streptomyces sp. (strain SPB074) TaxID=465543 RepID=UPI00055CCC50|nr:DUF5304 family protein [Streptomyces sp. SPB074]
MSEANPSQPPEDAPDDAWSAACAEDLAAERERRSREGRAETGTAAEELLRLADTLAEKLTGFTARAAGPVQGEAVRQAVGQARSFVEPVLARNPEVLGHLAAAGSELLAAYRSAVTGQEARWTREKPSRGPGEDPPRKRPHEERDGGRGERIDLD